jgi:hypothetical protein
MEAVNQLPKLANVLIESMNVDVEIELLTIEDHTLRSMLVNKEQELRDMKGSLKDIEVFITVLTVPSAFTHCILICRNKLKI